jgi:hypothetical protein
VRLEESGKFKIANISNTTISSCLNNTTMSYLNVLISSLMVQGHLTRYRSRLSQCLLFTQKHKLFTKHTATDNNSVSGSTPSSRLPHICVAAISRNPPSGPHTLWVMSPTRQTLPSDGLPGLLTPVTNRSTNP